MLSTEQFDSLKKDLSSILSEVAESKEIKNYEVKPDLQPQIGEGFLSNFYNGEIIDNDTKEIIHVAIKKIPTWEFDFEKIYKNEIIFYTKVLPALQELQDQGQIPDRFDNTPIYLASGLEPDKYFIAMKNLKTEGYVLHDKMKSLDKQQLEFIFKIYGKFHGLSFTWRKKDFEAYQKIHQEYTDVFSIFLLDKKQSENLARVLSVAVSTLDPNSAACEEVKDITKNVKSTFMKLCEYNGDYKCSTHGDCWSNNMLFKYSKSGKLEDVKLVDFQLARDGTPIHDLSYFFYSGASKSDLDAIEHYLKIYHNAFSKILTCLGENPEELFPFDTLVKEWKENAMLGVYLGLLLWEMKLVPKEEYTNILKGGQKEKDKKPTGAELQDLFKHLLEKVLKSDVYREKARDLLTHAFEYGVLRKEKIIAEEEQEDKPPEPITNKAL